MDSQLNRIHETSMRILNEIGIRLNHPDVIALVRKHGVRVEDDIAFFSDSQIERWIGKAPAEFTIHAVNPDHDMKIGGDHIEYSSGYGTTFVVQADGSRRPAILDDYITFARLVHQAPCFKLNGGILVQPSDILAELGNVLMLYTALTTSDKCVMGIPGHAEDMARQIELAAIAAGGMETFRSRPRLLTMISTISPLQIDRTALDAMMVCAEHNQPMIISPAPAAGITGPVTMAGNIALASAEALAAVSISQMLREGTPVIYGLQAYAGDLQSGQISIGSPGYAVQAGYCARLARMYGLPSRTGGTNTDAKSVGMQSGCEAMMSMLTSCQSGVNLIVHSAGILDSYGAISYEKFIADLEIIDRIESYLKGIRTETEDLAFDVIQEVGIGGQFLSTLHTAKRCRTESWAPTIGLRGHVSNDGPDQTYLENIGREKQRMLAEYQPPESCREISNQLQTHMTETLGIAPELIRRVTPGFNG